MWARKTFLPIEPITYQRHRGNYGGLPEGITIRDLKKEHNSVLRNPDIAQICFIRKYIEMLGSGTLRMINDCKKNNFKTPVWTDKEDITTVTFPELSINIKTNEGVNEGINEGVNNIAFIDESEGVNEELNVVYKLIDNTPGLKAPDVARLLNKSLSAAERYIKKLKDAGYIEFKGAPKTGGYFKK